MNDFIRPEERAPENLYENAGRLTDFRNELQKILIQGDEVHKFVPLVTVEEKYQNRKTETEKAYLAHPESRELHEAQSKKEETEIDEMIASHPEKVRRLDALVHLINTSDDLITIKRAANEIFRLLPQEPLSAEVLEEFERHGIKREEPRSLVYPEPEANPDLLEL